MLENTVVQHAGTSEPEAFSLTVVIPTVARLNKLSRCLESIHLQLEPQDNIIIVVNGPQQKFELVAEKLAEIPHIIHEPRQGNGWARATGLAAATTESVLFIDDDCVVMPGTISLVKQAFKSGASCVTGNIVALSTDTFIERWVDEQEMFKRGEENHIFRGGTDTAVSPIDAWRVGAGALFGFKQSALLHVGNFDPALGAGTPLGSSQDIDAIRRILGSGGTAYFLPEAQVAHAHPRTPLEYVRMKLRYAVGNGAYLAKQFFEERDSRIPAYFWRDCLWHIRIGLSQKEPGLPGHSMDLIDILRPLYMTLGVIRFLRYRTRLREGKRVPQFGLERTARFFATWLERAIPDNERETVFEATQL